MGVIDDLVASVAQLKADVAQLHAFANLQSEAIEGTARTLAAADKGKALYNTSDSELTVVTIAPTLPKDFRCWVYWIADEAGGVALADGVGATSDSSQDDGDNRPRKIDSRWASASIWIDSNPDGVSAHAVIEGMLTL